MPDSRPDAVGLGRRLKLLRIERGLDTATLSARTGLSRPFLNQVEAGTADPSMKSLRKIADALGVTLRSLFEGGPDDAAPPVAREPGPVGGATSLAGVARLLADELALRATRVREIAVVRQGRRKRLVWPNASDGQMLTPDLGSLIQVIITEQAAGDPHREPHTHAGESFYYVMDGRLEVIVAGTSYVLETGDSITFPSSLLHADRTISETPCRVLTVNVPPDF